MGGWVIALDYYEHITHVMVYRMVHPEARLLLLIRHPMPSLDKCVVEARIEYYNKGHEVKRYSTKGEHNRA